MPLTWHPWGANSRLVQPNVLAFHPLFSLSLCVAFFTLRGSCLSHLADDFLQQSVPLAAARGLGMFCQWHSQAGTVARRNPAIAGAGEAEPGPSRPQSEGNEVNQTANTRR